MITQIRTKLQKFLREDASSGAFWRRMLQDTLKFLYFVQKGISEKHCLQRAAGMAYSSLFALVPTLAVFLSVFSSIKYFPADLKIQIENWIFHNFIPETSQKLSDQLQAHVQGFASSALAIGLIGTIFMVVSVFMLMNTIEHIFDSIMQVEKERTFLHKLMSYTTLMVWAPVLIGLSMYFAAQHQLTIDLPFISKLNTFFRWAAVIAAFTFAYKIIPNTFISARDAMIGGIWAAILWEIARIAFSHYVSEMVGYDKIYGALGVIPLFLIWLYMVWVVVLVGMEVTFVCKNKKRLEKEFQPVKSPDAYALKILKRIGTQYLKGDSFESHRSLFKHLDLTELQLQKILDTLIQNQVIVKLPSGNLYTLAKNPEKLNPWSVVSLFHPTLKTETNPSGTTVIYTPLNAVFPPEAANFNLKEWIEGENKK